ncbi:hypothetical protein B0H65DRAFT_437050 [Neurospora tetraspora]|uniref:Uncharacterized protein n=1 Tax=Neurospora tetraspora TaxID=94610 RepID=A0AAE0J0F3_9PEZI|nr:hypothetical protein B0H65DRAFT_437050 [Neurospora tetraspora]
MDAHAQGNLPAEDHYARPPDFWVALLETLPLCDVCSESHVHLPGATRCIDCLENSPGPQRRRDMYRILHIGGFYCSSCYIRETPILGHSCARCLRMRLAAKLRRKLIARLVPARRKLAIVREVAESVGTEDNAVVAVKDAMRAILTVRNVFKLLDRAHQILRELTELDAARAGAIAPDFHDAVEVYQEVSRLAQDAFVSATAGWMGQENEDQHHAEALSNINSFVPQILAQHPEQHPAQQPEKHHAQHPGQHLAQQPEQHHAQHPGQHLAQHPGQHPAQQPEQHHIQEPGQHPAQHPEQHPIQQNPTANQHDDQHYPRVPLVDQNNLFDEIQHGPDDLLPNDYNIPPLVAPEEDNDDDDPYPDDILLAIDRFGHQEYNPVPQTDN